MLDPSAFILAIDFGLTNIGVAVGQKVTNTASELTTLKAKNGHPNWTEVRELVKTYSPSLLLVGYPLNMDGSFGRSAQSVKDTSQNIEKSINLPVCLWDERLSTVGAFNLSSQLDVNVSKREKKIDENAATFILQGAIDFLNN